MTGLDRPTGDRWLTYNEIGEMLGVSPEAARAIARRGKWQRQIANAVGRVVRVLVPAERLQLAAANGHDSTRQRSHPDESGLGQQRHSLTRDSGRRSHPDSANGQDNSSQWPNPDGSGFSQPPNPATQDSGQRPNAAESGRDQRTEQDRPLTALQEIADTLMAPVREQLADLKVQLVAER